MFKFDSLRSKYIEKTWFGLAAVLFMSIMTVVAPIYFGGIRRMGDLPSYVNFAQVFQTAISGGDLYPGWTNDNLGFGSLGTRFYPPLAPIAAALLQLLTNDWYFAFCLSLLGWMTVGCFGVYLFVRDWGTPLQAICAGMLYSIVPFHVAEIYRFFLYAEFAAGAILPFCLLYLTRVCRRGNWRDVVPLAVSFSALILTHLPLTIIAVFSLAVYVPIVIDWRRWRKISPQLLCSAALAAAATSFYWIRLALELPWLAHAGESYSIAGSGFGSFLFPNMLTAPDRPTLMNIYRHLDITIVLTMLLLVPFLGLLVAGRKKIFEPENRVLLSVTLAAIFGFFMLSVPSEFLWTNVSVLQRLQFPWRWLSAISIFAVASFAFSLPLLVRIERLSEKTGLFLIVFLSVVFIASDVRQIRSTSFRVPRAEFNQVANDTKSEPTAEHWWPVWARKGAFENTELLTVENRSVDISIWESGRRRFTVGEGESAILRVATFYYPYWRADVNGRAAEVDKDENGAITLPIGGEISVVDLRFEEPLSHVAASWLTAVVWMILLGVSGLRLGLAVRSPRNENDS